MFDTSVAIALRDGDSSVLERAARLGATAMLSILSVVELEGGVAAATVDRIKRRAALDELYAALNIVPFEVREARFYRSIIEELGFSRAKIIDRMIAAHAISAGAALATQNVRDFRGIPGLEVEDWSR